MIADKIHSRAKIVHVPPRLALQLGRLVGYFVRDVVLTEEEVEGLLANLLVSLQTPTGKIRFSDWLNQNTGILGTHYSSELLRHYK